MVYLILSDKMDLDKILKIQTTATEFWLHIIILILNWAEFSFQIKLTSKSIVLVKSKTVPKLNEWSNSK